MVNSKVIRVFVVLFLVFGASSFASAVETGNATLYGNSGPYMDFVTNNTINLTVGAINGNVTQIHISFSGLQSTDPIVLLNGTNASDVASNFSSSVSIGDGGTTVINVTFSNTSSQGIVPNGSTQNFWFIVKGRKFTGSLVVMSVNVSNASGASNTTSFSFQPSFAFEGYIRNETGCGDCLQNGTNVSLLGILPGVNGPDSSIVLASELSNLSGFFRLLRVNASASYRGYRLEMVFYNTSSVATKTGAILPYFPSFMYYPSSGDDFGGFDMTLNGGTFYLQPASTIRLWATNGSTQVSFGYMLMDQVLGFPVKSETMQKITNDSIVVPSGRAYTATFFRMFGYPGGNFGYLENFTLCLNNATSDFMNDTLCPAPPKSFSISTNNTVQGAVLVINQSLIVRKTSVVGCLNIENASYTNNSAINVTAISIKMMPWSSDSGSFIPPGGADDGTLNITKDINYTTTGCTYAHYNLTLLNDTGYMIEFFAKNASDESGHPGAGTYTLAAYRNVTVLDSAATTRLNATLYRLVGSYYNTSTVAVGRNTSLLKVNVLNSSGGLITTQLGVNLKIKHSASGVGILNYIISDSAVVNGTFYIPVLNNSNYAKVMVFSSNGPPRETKLNLSASEVNVTIVSMDEDKGFRKFHSNGTIEEKDVDSSPIRMRFLSTGSDCDYINPPSSCIVTEMNASGFNPLKALLAGKVNMEIKIISTNVTLLFHDYDMMTAKQPPMNSIMNDNSSQRSISGTSMEEVWQFGSFAPADSYTNVTIALSYSDVQTASNFMNDTITPNVSLPLLYNENGAVIWNQSAGDTNNSIPEDYAEYNYVFFRALINGTNVSCSNTTNTGVCSINLTDNFVALRVPHFSTIGEGISSSSVPPVSTTSSTTTSSSGGGGSGGFGDVYWVSTVVRSDKELKDKVTVSELLKERERVRFKLNGELHHLGVISITGGTVTFNVSSAPQQASLVAGESKKFDVGGDSLYDIRASLHEIKTVSGVQRANITIEYVQDAISEIPPSNASSGTTVNEAALSNQTSPTTSDSTPRSTPSWIIATLVIVILVCVLAIVFYYMRMGRRKKYGY